MTTPVLEVEDLRVHFGTFDGDAKVLEGVNLDVGRGEVVAVAGETGCGKSVTMKAILGVLAQPPAKIPSGSIRFMGQDLLEMSERERQELMGHQMSMVYQDPMSGLNPVFTVGEQLTDTAQFGGRSGTGPLGYLRQRFASDDRAAARERVLELLREVQMPDPERVMDSYPTQLSGGMRQRALIAQALLNEPEFLIADEIGTALDVTVHDQILALLERLIDERNLSVLMITHNLGVARRIADRINVMYAGRIVETAPTAELFEAPRHPYTQGLIASIPRLTGEDMAAGIDGAIPEYLDPPAGCRFAPRCPYVHDRCEAERPPRYDGGTDGGVACFLYDEDTMDPSDLPTLAETRAQMGTATDGPAAEEVGR